MWPMKWDEVSQSVMVGDGVCDRSLCAGGGCGTPSLHMVAAQYLVGTIPDTLQETGLIRWTLNSTNEQRQMVLGED